MRRLRTTITLNTVALAAFELTGAHVAAPSDGVVLFLTTSAALDYNGLTPGLGTDFATD
jgi:hypothetical protein